ncbi:MAG TPA: ATPase domain-containing protein [Candidatus Angelobacter sp.]|nr:ATPase domain-containing protein [Candidatus Angelobacter sp.]
MPPARQPETRLKTGIPGLDDILHGGLPRGHLYLVEGNPGSGKTTFGLQFLLAGIAAGEHALYVTLAESQAELEQVGASHRFDLSGIEIFEVNPPELSSASLEQYTVFHPSEVELADVMNSILERVTKTKAARIVIDSMSELRMLARDPLRYRRQIMTLKQFFMGQNTTVLLLDDRSGEGTDTQLQSIAHGVLRMETLEREFGVVRRQFEVRKLRASAFREGFHDYVIRSGGLNFFPRLVAVEHSQKNVDGTLLSSGIDELDRLLGGGVSRASSTLLLGPAGIGKSTLVGVYMVSAAARGERGVIFAFDEVTESILVRCRGLGIPLDDHIKKGLIRVVEMDPAAVSPGEFVAQIRMEVEENNCRLIAIDSLNGLFHAMREEHAMAVQLHDLIAYLNLSGVASFMILAQYGVIGSHMTVPVDISYLADNVLLFRYFEARGTVKQAISVVKRRSGPHERSIRELLMGANTIQIGMPLHDFEGVLTGTPRYVGGSKPLLDKE